MILSRSLLRWALEADRDWAFAEGKTGFIDTSTDKEMDCEIIKTLDLDGLVHGIAQTGASVSKCCHFFHIDCLYEYLTAEQVQNFEKRYMRKLIGLDDDYI